jgi:hypothetical protein
MRLLAALLIVAAACATRPSKAPVQPPQIQSPEPEPDPAPEPAPEPMPAPEPEPTREPPTPTPTPTPEVTTAYDRDAWPLWIDADGDCQDTRTEVLIEESEIAVTFTNDRKCTVASGRWRCPYTDRTFTDPKQLDIDHLVPLQHAHDSGGFAWDKKKRTAFANALDDPEHLVAVYRSSNRSKGARAVDVWLPEEPGFRCQYVDAWRRIKSTWKLAESATERAAIDDALAKCRSKDVPDRPTAPARDPRPKTLDVREPPSGSCCKICKSGKACGDSCIALEKTCKRPPGCAC